MLRRWRRRLRCRRRVRRKGREEDEDSNESEEGGAPPNTEDDEDDEDDEEDEATKAMKATRRTRRTRRRRRTRKRRTRRKTRGRTRAPPKRRRRRAPATNLPQAGQTSQEEAFFGHRDGATARLDLYPSAELVLGYKGTYKPPITQRATHVGYAESDKPKPIVFGPTQITVIEHATDTPGNPHFHRAWYVVIKANDGANNPVFKLHCLAKAAAQKCLNKFKKARSTCAHSARLCNLPPVFGQMPENIALRPELCDWEPCRKPSKKASSSEGKKTAPAASAVAKKKRGPDKAGLDAEQKSVKIKKARPCNCSRRERVGDGRSAS